MLAGRLGLATRGTVHDLLDSVVARLRNSGRVLLGVHYFSDVLGGLLWAGMVLPWAATICGNSAGS